MISPLLTATAFFLTLGGALWVLGYRLIVRPAQLRARLGDPVMAGHPTKQRKSASQYLFDVFRRIGNIRAGGPGSLLLKQQLINSGYRTESAPQTFIGLQTASLAVFLIGAAFLPLGDNANPALRMIMLMGGAGIGWRVPTFLLKRKVAQRQERLRLALPDALDLIIISVEAGLGLDQAIQHVAQELHGGEHRELAEELQLIGMEMRAGMRRADALTAFGDRTGEEEIQKLAAILVQNDKFGTSMSEAMRGHSQYMRVQRRQQADERAAKVGVKLVFPIFFFILPSMMLIAAGPGILQIFKYLFPMMKQLR